MALLTRPGAQIFYEIIGADTSPENARWITLVNGHTRSSSDFKLMAKFLSGKGWNVLVLDNRGCGKTESSRDFLGQEMVDDVVALWDEAGIVKSSVLGVSMGGMIVQYLALRFHSRVSSVILVSTTPHRKHVISSRTPWIADIGEIREKLNRFFAPSFAARNTQLIAAMAKNTLRAIETGRFLKGVAQQTLAMASFEDPIDFSQMTMPVLVLHGESDQIIGLDAVAEFARLIKGAQIQTYPEVGHLILAEAPKQLYTDVEAFLIKGTD